MPYVYIYMNYVFHIHQGIYEHALIDKKIIYLCFINSVYFSFFSFSSFLFSSSSFFFFLFLTKSHHVAFAGLELFVVQADLNVPENPLLRLRSTRPLWFCLVKPICWKGFGFITTLCVSFSVPEEWADCWCLTCTMSHLVLNIININ